MKICLVGWGVETQSAWRYFGNEHEYLLVSEENRDDFPRDANVHLQTLTDKRKPGLTSSVTDLSYLDGIEDTELIIYTPTARKNLEKRYEADHAIWQKCKTIQHIFFENCPTNNIIGVTGTKGKGTTTTLIATLLQKAGKKVHIGGNIGIPVLDILPSIQQDDWVVLELSSFQLYKFPYSPHIAVHLMMVPEHIDEWHKTMEDYVTAKRNIFAHQKAGDIAIYHAENQYAAANVAASSGQKTAYLKRPGAYVENDWVVIDDRKIIETSGVALPGRHNLDNICAAVTAAWQVVQDTENFAAVLRTFTGLEHRLQLVRTVNDVRYYDDSFGTTPDTAVVALDAFEGEKIIIVGGHDKGNDFSTLLQRLQQKDVKFIIAIGTTGNNIAQFLLQHDFDSSRIAYKADANAWTMTEIVELAQSKAQANDIVLLSTGSASFGLFKDYKDRGNQFIDAVNQL